jgi:cytochrome P450
MTTSIELEWASPAFLADPYPFYHRLRAADHIHWHPTGFWLVTRYADAVAILRDPRFVRPPVKLAEHIDPLIEQQQLSPSGFLRAYGILWQNPPDHTRLRRLFNKAFTPGIVNELRPRIRAVVDELLNGVQASDTMELISDFAYVLPVMVIAELLGVPLAARDSLRQWSRDWWAPSIPQGLQAPCSGVTALSKTS